MAGVHSGWLVDYGDGRVMPAAIEVDGTGGVHVGSIVHLGSGRYAQAVVVVPLGASQVTRATVDLGDDDYADALSIVSGSGAHSGSVVDLGNGQYARAIVVVDAAGTPVTGNIVDLGGGRTAIPVVRLDANGDEVAEGELAATVLDLSSVTGITSNNAARFTRANSEYLSVADSAVLNFAGDKSFTIVSWMKPVTNTAGEFIATLGKWSGTGTAQQYLLGWRGSTNRFSMLVNNGASVVAAHAAITALVNGTWYFVVGYHDAAGNVIGVSVNDSARTTTAQAGSLQASTQAVEIGRSNSTAIHYADAVMQGVGVFNEVITLAEQTWLYNAGAGRRFADLEGQPALLAKCVAWWDLSEDGGVRYDRVGALNLTDNATVTTDVGVATSAARDRDPISGIADQSASANNGAQTTVTARPLYRTSRTITLLPALVFDGVDDAVDLGTALALTGDFTLMWVQRLNVSGAILGHASGTGRIVQTDGTTLTVTNDAGASVALTHADLVGADFKACWLRRSGTTLSCGVGTAQADADTLSGTITVGRVGRHGAATSPYNGELTHLRHYDGALTAGQISSEAGALITTYGAS